jgi:hypothetical protein
MQNGEVNIDCNIFVYAEHPKVTSSYNARNMRAKELGNYNSSYVIAAATAHVFPNFQLTSTSNASRPSA